MLKKFRKMITLLLCAAFAMNISALAATPDIIQPQNNFQIRTGTASLTKSGTNLCVKFNIGTNASCSKIGVESITLYDRTTGGHEKFSGATISGAVSHSGSIPLPSQKGHTYYALVQLVAQPYGGSAAYKQHIITDAVQL